MVSRSGGSTAAALAARRDYVGGPADHKNNFDFIATPSVGFAPGSTDPTMGPGDSFLPEWHSGSKPFLYGRRSLGSSLSRRIHGDGLPTDGDRPEHEYRRFHQHLHQWWRTKILSKNGGDLYCLIGGGTDFTQADGQSHPSRSQGLS